MSDAAIYKLLHYLSLLDAGCPVGRHELRDEEWLAIGVLKGEREAITLERGKNKGDHGETGQ